jgi:hypothetical protein
MTTNNIEYTLNKVSSNVDRTYDLFFGSFEILQGQFIHLDGYIVNIDNEHLKILKSGIKTNIHDYSINSSKLRYHNAELLPSMIITINNLNKFNIPPQDPVSDLLENTLHFRSPTTIYITYHSDHNVYSVKNMNMATMFLMKKITTNL